MSGKTKPGADGDAPEIWKQCGYRAKPTLGASSQARGAARLRAILARSKSRDNSETKMRPNEVPDNGRDVWERDGWVRETHVASRTEAKRKTEEFFRRFPRNSYLAEIESWRVLEDERIEFVLRSHPK